MSLLDEVSETPELIWTKEMQGELRTALNSLLINHTQKYNSSESDDKNIKPNFENSIIIDSEYAVYYRQLAEELFVGGVSYFCVCHFIMCIGLCAFIFKTANF